MSKPYEGSWVLRSLLFVPSHIEKMVIKAATSAADCVVLDLEDAVPEDQKQTAREGIRVALADGRYRRKTVFVRINPIDSGLTLRDLDSVSCAELHGFVYPMAQSEDDIKKFDAQLSLIECHLGVAKGHFSLIVLIETPGAVLNAQKIATASDRVVGLLYGCEDYLAEMGARHTELDLSLHTPRMMTALAARAAGVEPIDTPYVRVHDAEGLRVFAGRARDLGMAGMLTMSPRQVEIANEVYTPGPDEVRYCEEVVAAADEARKAGRGIVIVNDKFISPPTLKAARKTLERHYSIMNLEAFGLGED